MHLSEVIRELSHNELAASCERAGMPNVSRAGYSERLAYMLSLSDDAAKLAMGDELIQSCIASMRDAEDSWLSMFNGSRWGMVA